MDWTIGVLNLAVRSLRNGDYQGAVRVLAAGGRMGVESGRGVWQGRISHVAGATQ